MTVPRSFLVFNDLYRLEDYWPGVLKRAPGCGIVGCLFPHAQTGLWISGKKGMRVTFSPHPHHYTLLFVLYCSILLASLPASGLAPSVLHRAHHQKYPPS